MRTAALLLAAALVGQAAPKHTVMAVFAHPDDETVVGPLLAKYAKEGHKVYLVTLTAGQLGTAPHANIPAGDKLAAVRTGELACAAKALGLTDHRLLTYQDQGFAVGWDAQPMNKAAEDIRRLIDEWKPDVVITWGPDGGSGHPDHRTASNVTTQAFQMQSLLKHKPRKLYYVAFPETPGTSQSYAPSRQVSASFITTQIDAAGYLKQAFEAVQCHKSQWSPEQMEGIRKMAEQMKGRISLRLAMTAGRTQEADLFQ